MSSRILNIPVPWGSTVFGVARGDWIGVDGSGHDLVIPSFKINLGATGVDGGFVSASNPFPVSQPSASTGVNTSVAGAASDTSLLAANAARRGATVFNDSTVTLSLLLGATAASATNFTMKVAAGGYYEVPFGYTGAVRGIWASATGNARITELT